VNVASHLSHVDAGNNRMQNRRPLKIWGQNVEFPVFSTPIINSIHGSLVVVVVINVKGDVVIFDYVNDGTVLWKHSVNANVFCSPILLPYEVERSSDRIIVFGAQDKHLHSIIISSVGEIETSGSKTKYIEMEKRHSSFESTLFNCYEQWKVKHSKDIYATPYAFYGDVECTCQPCQRPNFTNPNKAMDAMKKSLFVASVSTDGLLNIICVNSGLVMKQHSLGNNIYSSPVIVKNHIVIGNRDNFLTCFKFS